MTITTELVGKLGGASGYFWSPAPNVTYDLGPNYPQRIAIAYNFSGNRGLFCNDVQLSASTSVGYWILPDEKNVPNPRYIRITGGSGETGAGKFISVIPIPDGKTPPPTV